MCSPVCVCVCVCVCVLGGLFLRAGHHFASAYHFLSNLTEEGAMLEPNISFTLN